VIRAFSAAAELLAMGALIAGGACLIALASLL
jgi:hypothetical protein